MNRKILIILIVAMLNAIGMTIVLPLLPFLLEFYIPTNQIALYLGILISIYAGCSFFMAPVMGALSDYFGRKPIIILSLLGTGVGYFIMGIGGALWVLFLGRIIDGICAGDISTLYAYVADSVEGKERAKIYGYLGAANGIGFMIGPAIGGLLGIKYLSLPFFVAGGVSIITAIAAYFVISETLEKEKRTKVISFHSFNTFTHFKDILCVQSIRKIIILGVFFSIGLILYQSNISVFAKNIFNLNSAYIGALFVLIGFCDIISRAILLPKLLKFSDKSVGSSGLILMIIGFSFIVISVHYQIIFLLLIAVIFITIGEGLFDPHYNNMLSHAVNENEQGKLQGVNQSIQSLLYMIFPAVSGVIYLYHPAVLYIVVAFLTIIAFVYIHKQS
ncbi:MFS transporter [Francisella philomiragia]|uniref:MFS transporter n=1 Tax=Francisella philomiragia TaxID=28110 RepID=UPI0035163BAE